VLTHGEHVREPRSELPPMRGSRGL
jgi:hypothetical protein